MSTSSFTFNDLEDEYSHLWSTMEIRAERIGAVTSARDRIKAREAKYREVTNRIGVPWIVVGIIHSLESNCNDNTHLHNGDPLTARTVQKPSGRPLTGSPPFEWVASAVDALTSHNLDKVGEWPTERIAYELERYNGWGYRLAPGRGHSPYLWSFTGHYQTGKFKADGDYDPNLESDQAGGMALLKVLADSGAAVEIVTVEDAAKIKPLVSGLWLAKEPVELLPTEDAPSSDDNDTVEINEPCEKIREAGPLWELNVFANSGDKKHGFAPGDVFEAQKLPFDIIDADLFALLCINAARMHDTSGRHLIAVADTETGIKNVAAAKGDGVGPFLIGVDAWAAANPDASHRNDPYKQPFVAGKIAADAEAALKTIISNRLPTSAELYLAHLVGPSKIAAILSNGDAVLKTAISAAIGAESYDVLSSVRPWLFNNTITVKAALEKAARRLDFGYVRADGLYERIEQSAPVASGFANRLRDSAIAEWKFFGEQTYNLAGATTHSGHKEDERRNPAGTGEDWFARVGAYWKEGVGERSLDGRNTGHPWSAAFISYAAKKAGAGATFRYSARHSIYISKAIRDKNDETQDVAYWCFRLDDCKPKVGDLVCWSRQLGVDYDHQFGGQYAGHCDIVVEVAQDELKVIGGNVGQSVTQRPLALDADGKLRPRSGGGETLFAVMQNRLP